MTSIFQAITDGQSRVDQGDVFIDIPFPATEERASAVVVNPPCDFEHGKADFVKLISTVPFDDVIRLVLLTAGIEAETLDSGQSVSKKRYERALEALADNINGNLYPRYYLLPGYSTLFPTSFLDFQRVFVIPVETVRETYPRNRVTRIASPWREQIATRYTGYAVRIGTPDFSRRDLAEFLELAGLHVPPDLEP